MQKQRIVLIGNQGAGKTSFFNLITSSNEPTQKNQNSCTRQIVLGYTQWEQRMEVIDTPGFNADESKLCHAAGIIAGLQYGPVNRILIFIKSEHSQDMKQYLDTAFKPVSRYKHLVTIVITHRDKCSNPYYQENNMLQFLETQYQISSLIFVSKYDEPEIICQTIQSLITTQSNLKGNSESIDLLDSEIFQYFDFLDQQDQDKCDIEIDKAKVLSQFRDIAYKFKSFINKLDVQNEDYLDILHQSILLINEKANQLVDDYENKNRERIQNLVDTQGNSISYLHYIILKKELSKDLKNLINIAQRRMENSNYHVLSFIKKCQYCGQIWLKAIGCEKDTYCGQQMNSDFDGLFMKLSKNKIQLQFDDRNEIIVNKMNQQQHSKEELEFNYLLLFLLKHKVIIQSQISETMIKSILQQLYGPNYKIQVIQCINKGLLEIELINDIIFNYLIELDEEDLYNQLQAQLQQQKKQKKGGIGCGNLLKWSEQLPLTNSELNELLSADILEYFADQEKTNENSIDWLSKHYKDIIFKSIQEQLKHIRRVNNYIS